MAAKEILVLVIDDDGLRSMLSGRLSLEGELLATYDSSIAKEGPARLSKKPAILITDDPSIAAIDGSSTGAENWAGRILVGASAPPADAPDNFAIVERASAVPQIREILLRWRRPGDRGQV